MKARWAGGAMTGFWVATKAQFDVARRFYLCRDFEMSKVSSGDSKNTLYPAVKHS
jgi:hypothetical protein